MPYIQNTPESLIQRADSKNPSSTCRGITTSGRPCRRPRIKDNASSSLEGLYCWQHQDQASASLASSTQSSPNGKASYKLQHRSSLETLAERLGLVDLDDQATGRPDRHGKKKCSAFTKHEKDSSSKSNSFSFCLCAPIVEVEEPPHPVRPRPHPIQRPAKDHDHHLPSTPQSSPPKTPSSELSMSRMKHLIPNDLDAAAASALLAELAKPYDKSEQPGYIYMYWLTATGPQSPDAARAMLSPPDVPSKTSSSGVSGTMTLKIGRSDNVQRRMNEWRRQCGRDVTLLRFYPYSPSSSSPPPSHPHSHSPPPSSPSPSPSTVRMTPHAHRVEQLIQLELKGRGMKADMGKCSACGKEHKEWFNVPASRSAVGLVDGIIRRWIKWDEGQLKA
ncbi:T5orf172 [Geosmithia morbida]|uniref:T5orf172 n=1 Tax=Geosmithia morbida TaxID=1094350 RepID=A0A9P4YRP7_9HYPO|nr:T5orf172 [Geosmithia morbida]KAF4121883.1 T5orf172 [Geosmithia morbida]